MGTGAFKESERMRSSVRAIRMGVWALAMAGAFSAPALARLSPDDPEYQGFREYEKEVLARMSPASGRAGARPMAIPDVFGPGAVLDVGNVVMKVTNFGLVGNPFTNISSDPSCQWPGKSAVEYMNFCGVAMGAVNPFASDPNAVRRVSITTEWRPATLDAEDRMYRAYDGIINGVRFTNDDSDSDPLTGDGLYDEDFLDGRDNDGDGRIDEDFAAIGQQQYTCVIRDDTEQAIAAAAAERHVPLGVECRQTAWAYSIPGFTDFNVVNWKFFNRSGHELDSVVIGFRVDMDCGPTEKSNFFSDDFDVPQYPFGRFLVQTKDTDLRKQDAGTHPGVTDVDPDSALCPRFTITVQGFSVADDDTDENKTLGVPHFLLIDHTIDPLGETGPRKVGFRAYRSFPVGTPYVQGGNPLIDQQRFELMTGHDNVASDVTNPSLLGFINQIPGDQKSDYTAWASIGPWLRWQPNAELECTFAIGVRNGDLRTALAYANDYLSQTTVIARDPLTQEDIYGVVSGTDLLERYEVLDNAVAAQLAFEGGWESRPWPLLTDFHGRETAIKAPPGQVLQISGCEARDPVLRPVTDRRYEWFDFDCDYCTGAYSSRSGGLFHRTWLAESPPPSPNTNLGVTYNFTDNPDRRYPPAGDGQVTIAWDNLSEVSPDPKTGWFDFRSYQIWKVSNWRRPVGSGGPAEDDWTLLAEFRQFECGPDTSCRRITSQGRPYCRTLYIPQREMTEQVCLNKGDLFDPQSGLIIAPDPAVPCIGYPDCVVDSALVLGSSAAKEGRIRYPVGRYRYVDTDVKNGFIYFYSVTGRDSTGSGQGRVELAGRRSAVEAEGIVPQGAAGARSSVWVVPNPYRGLRSIQERPSAWDLTPNASDPTGTHIDFLGLPSGQWTIKIFTLSGDLVNTITSRDEIDASTRGSVVIDSQGVPRRNTTRQQDTANDGQARWNLISRNGQDIVSGIYLFTVESSRGTERGKFVVIR